MHNPKINKVALILKIVAWIIWVVALIDTAMIWGNTPITMEVDTAKILLTFFGGLAIGFIIFAFGEVVSLLHKIAMNTEKPKSNDKHNITVEM